MSGSLSEKDGQPAWISGAEVYRLAPIADHARSKQEEKAYDALFKAVKEGATMTSVTGCIFHRETKGEGMEAHTLRVTAFESQPKVIPFHGVGPVR